MRFSRAAAWGAASATIVLAASTGTLLAMRPMSSGLGPGSIVYPIPFAAMAVVGALVASRHPRNSTGWLFLATAFLMVSNAFEQSYVLFTRGHYPPASHLAAWLASWTWVPAAALIGVVLMVFPSGRPPSPRWRWAVRASYALITLVAFSAILTWPASTRDLIGQVSNGPSPDLPGSGLVTSVQLGVQAVLPLGFVAVVVRFVRSRGIERQQLKWFVYGTSFIALGILINVFLIVVLAVENPIDNPVDAASILIGLTAIPVTAGIAILRYRLYDIDRLISRTVTYALVSAVVAGVYVLVVLVPTSLLRHGHTPTLLVAAGTIIAAALFRPVRRRVQNAIDRRFNRSSYDAAWAIEAFSTRLRDEVDIDELTNDLQTLVHQTMEPAHISVWLREPPT